MVENIIFIPHLFNAAVIVSRQRRLFLSAPIAYVSVGDDRAAVLKSAVRIFARCVAQLVILPRGIDEIVQPVEFSDRRSLEKGVFPKRRSLRAVGYNARRLA